MNPFPFPLIIDPIPNNLGQVRVLVAHPTCQVIDTEELPKPFGSPEWKSEPEVDEILQALIGTRHNA